MNMHNPPKSGGNGAGNGKGRRKSPRTPKGRQIDPVALAEIQALLTDRPRRRDLLIEHLHLIQDHYGHLSAPHLAALAAELKMAQAEVYEVATFYAHFDVVKDGPVPPAVTVRVCELAVLRDGRRRSPGRQAACHSRQGRPRGSRALHGRLRPCAGCRRRSYADLQGDDRQCRRGRQSQAACPCLETDDRSGRLSKSRRLCAAQGRSVGQAHASTN